MTDHRSPQTQAAERIAAAHAAMPPADHNGQPIGPPVTFRYDTSGRFIGAADPRRAAVDFLAALTNDEFDALAREARNPERTRQLTRDDLRGMTPEAIVTAKN